MYTVFGILFTLIPPALALGMRKYVKRVPEQADPGLGTKATAALTGLVLAGLFGVLCGMILAAHPVVGVLGFVSLAFSVVGSAIWLARYDKKTDRVRESGGVIRRFKTRALAGYAYLMGKLVNRFQKSRVRAAIGVYENLVDEGEAQIEAARRLEDRLKDDPTAKRERRGVQERRRLVQKEVAALKQTVNELKTVLDQDAIPGLAIERPALLDQVSQIPAQLGLGSLPVITTPSKDLPRLESKGSTQPEALPAPDADANGGTAAGA